MELRVGGKYKITKRLGFGAFGDIFAGINVKTNEEVAIKLVSLWAGLNALIWTGDAWICEALAAVWGDCYKTAIR